MRVVADAASGIIRARTPGVLRKVMEEALKRLLPLDAFFFLSYDAEAHAFRGIGGYDAGVYSQPDLIPAAGTPGERVVRERRTLVTLSADDDAAGGSRLTGTGRRSESIIRTPVIAGDDVLGFLSIQSYTPNVYTAEDVEVVEMLASLAAAALESFRSDASHHTIFELEERVEERTAELLERTVELERHRSELEQAEHRFRAIVEASPTPLLLSLASDGTVLFANDRLEDMIGVPPGSLIGKKTPEFYFDPNDRPAVIEAVQRQGYVRDWELRIKRADGTPIWVSLSIQRLVFDGQQAIASSLLDITDRIEAEEARQQYARSLEQELELGRQIQRGFFPESLPEAPGWEISARFHPARQVAGDFYDVFDVKPGRIGLVVADVCGKGVGAALFMALVRSLIRAYTDRASVAPSASAIAILLEATTLANGYVTRVHRSAHMFASVFFGILEPSTGFLQYVNAGHLPPVVVDRDGNQRLLPPSGPAIGLIRDAPFEIRQTVLRPGEMLVAYTDGVTEARDESGEFFSEERLYDLLVAGTSAAANLDAIEGAVSSHTGDGARFDDMTLLAIRREEST